MKLGVLSNSSAVNLFL